MFFIFRSILSLRFGKINSIHFIFRRECIYENLLERNLQKHHWFQDQTAPAGKGLSQAALASQLQLLGMECSDLTILRIEQGSRFVPDYEVAILAKYFNISTDTLLEQKEADS